MWSELKGCNSNPINPFIRLTPVLTKISTVNAIIRINGSDYGRCLRPGYPLIRLQALRTWPVSAPIPNAERVKLKTMPLRAQRGNRTEA
jgi:hypothetical protein